MATKAYKIGSKRVNALLWGVRIRCTGALEKTRDCYNCSLGRIMQNREKAHHVLFIDTFRANGFSFTALCDPLDRWSRHSPLAKIPPNIAPPPSKRMYVLLLMTHYIYISFGFSVFNNDVAGNETSYSFRSTRTRTRARHTVSHKNVLNTWLNIFLIVLI